MRNDTVKLSRAIKRLLKTFVRALTDIASFGTRAAFVPDEARLKGVPNPDEIIRGRYECHY